MIMTQQTNAPTTPNQSSKLQPGVLYVKKRDGNIVNFDCYRIETALKKAFLATEKEKAYYSEHIQQSVLSLTGTVNDTIIDRYKNGGVIEIEMIQDVVELTLMKAGEHKVARAYVLYRNQRESDRTEQSKPHQKNTFTISVTEHSEPSITEEWLNNYVTQACSALEPINLEPIIFEAKQNLFDGISINDVKKSLILSARTLVETDPNYTYVTAQLLLETLFDEASQALSLSENFLSSDKQQQYQIAFEAYISKGIECQLLNTNLKDFDLTKLASAIKPELDRNFTYLSLQTLYDRYFIHHNKKRIELPQIFFMRVAMGLAHCEGEARNERAIEFYQLLSSFDYMTSTPTLFNSGTLRPQLSSCYLTTVGDDLNSIYKSIKDNALLSKFAGGLGNDWTNVRAMGAHIKGTNGESQGIVPFLNVADATAVAVNQGGKRKGAVCAYLESWHLDIEEFLELRKNTGDERRRTHDMNTANWIPDLLVKRVINKEDWTLFSPDETPDLHDLYGPHFEQAYTAYEQQAKENKIRSKTIKAVDLWRKMLSMLFETGHPWLTFKDPCNLRSPQQHCGVVHSSNLCTEITLNTSKDEIAVCNLGSINLAQHITNGALNEKKLESTIKTAIRMLDNVIDINFYSVPEARNSNLKHRPIGLGIMGFQDMLYQLKIPYASDDAVVLADKSMELISYFAIKASSDLAVERDCYSSYPGSTWSKGQLPIDTLQAFKGIRGDYLLQDMGSTLDWDALRKTVEQQGMRNSNVMAIAPTATISNICGVTQSIEPTYENLYVKSNLSGEFTVINPYLYQELKQIDLWDSAMIHDLKYYNGSVKSIERIPNAIKQRYATAFEIEPKWLIHAASRRQKWIDQAQSLNLYIEQPSGKQLNAMYKEAWLMGLKTTYYLRSMGASTTEKSTFTDKALNAVSNPVKICSINDPDCEACQ